MSVAKAGIITTLNARTSVLASANPIDSKYNPKKSVIDNINLPPTLLSRYFCVLSRSRFDVIFLLLDHIDHEMDQQLGRHVISLFTRTHDPETLNYLVVYFPNLKDSKSLSSYIRFGRSIDPSLSDAAVAAISNGYVAMRKVNGSSGKTISATTRQLESLIRLSEAHARARLSHVVEETDVLEAIRYFAVY